MAYADLVIADGASHYWRLGETAGTTAVDVVGAVDGTISGGVTLGQVGALLDGNPAMAFDGSTGKIVTAAPIDLRTPYTLELWVRMTTGGANDPLVGMRNGPVDSGYCVLVHSVTGGVYLYHGGLAVGTGATPTDIDDGVWHHVVMVVNGTATVRFYVDGVDQAVPPLPAPYGAGTATHVVEVGWDSGGAKFLAGMLDEVAIYPSVLTPAQVAAHYAARVLLPPAGPSVVIATVDQTMATRAYSLRYRVPTRRARPGRVRNRRPGLDRDRLPPTD